MKESLQYKLMCAVAEFFATEFGCKNQSVKLFQAYDDLKKLDKWELQDDKYLADFCTQWDNELLRCSIRKWNEDGKFTFHFYSGDECHSPFFDTFDECVAGVKQRLLK